MGSCRLTLQLLLLHVRNRGCHIICTTAGRLLGRRLWLVLLLLLNLVVSRFRLPFRSYNFLSYGCHWLLRSFGLRRRLTLFLPLFVAFPCVFLSL